MNAEVCTACGSEYIGQETLKEVEKEIKGRKIFAWREKSRLPGPGNPL